MKVAWKLVADAEVPADLRSDAFRFAIDQLCGPRPRMMLTPFPSF